jgi:magnesium-transporting ATPase (P-type)
MMKGAPEVILKRCSHASIDGEIIEIDEEFRKQCQVSRCLNFITLLIALSMLGNFLAMKDV